MATANNKQVQRQARRARIRSRVTGTSERPRLAVFKSNRFIYVQLINDEMGTTLAASDARSAKEKTARERAQWVGKDIAEKAKKAGVTQVVFDRGGYRYQGIIAALAESARQEGLVF